MSTRDEGAENKKTPEGDSLHSLTLNEDNYTLTIRQNLLDLLGEYRELDFPANPELLKLHIDATTERIEALITTHQRRLLARIDKEVIGKDEIADPMNQPYGVNTGYDFAVARRSGKNDLRAEQRTKLKAIQSEKELL